MSRENICSAINLTVYIRVIKEWENNRVEA